MLNKKALLGVVFFSLVFAVCPLMYGQATGSFSGTVSDKAGAVISGATVTVTSQETGLSREAKTDDSGHYLIPLLPVSNYTIRVSIAGIPDDGAEGCSAAGRRASRIGFLACACIGEHVR